MEIRIESIGTTLVVKLAGEIDQSCAEEIRGDIDREITLRHAQNLILDFAAVDFMDSSGLGMIIGRYKQMKARGGYRSGKGLIAAFAGKFQLHIVIHCVPPYRLNHALLANLMLVIRTRLNRRNFGIF